MTIEISWVFPWKLVKFHSYVNVYQRVSNLEINMGWMTLVHHVLTLINHPIVGGSWGFFLHLCRILTSHYPFLQSKTMDHCKVIIIIHHNRRHDFCRVQSQFHKPQLAWNCKQTVWVSKHRSHSDNSRDWCKDVSFPISFHSTTLLTSFCNPTQKIMLVKLGYHWFYPLKIWRTIYQVSSIKRINRYQFGKLK